MKTWMDVEEAGRVRCVEAQVLAERVMIVERAVIVEGLLYSLKRQLSQSQMIRKFTTLSVSS